MDLQEKKEYFVKLEWCIQVLSDSISSIDNSLKLVTKVFNDLVETVRIGQKEEVNS